MSRGTPQPPPSQSRLPRHTTPFEGGTDDRSRPPHSCEDSRYVVGWKFLCPVPWLRAPWPIVANLATDWLYCSSSNISKWDVAHCRREDPAAQAQARSAHKQSSLRPHASTRVSSEPPFRSSHSNCHCRDLRPPQSHIAGEGRPLLLVHLTIFFPILFDALVLL